MALLGSCVATRWFPGPRLQWKEMSAMQVHDFFLLCKMIFLISTPKQVSSFFYFWHFPLPQWVKPHPPDLVEELTIVASWLLAALHQIHSLRNGAQDLHITF